MIAIYLLVFKPQNGAPRDHCIQGNFEKDAEFERENKERPYLAKKSFRNRCFYFLQTVLCVDMVDA